MQGGHGDSGSPSCTEPQQARLSMISTPILSVSPPAKVDDLKAKLAVQEVELKQKNEDADKLIHVVGIETEKVSKEKAIADEEELKVQAINRVRGAEPVPTTLRPNTGQGSMSSVSSSRSPCPLASPECGREAASLRDRPGESRASARSRPGGPQHAQQGG